MIVKEWKAVFKRDYMHKIEAAKEEYQSYKSGGGRIKLQQACGKMFSAVENYLMLKYGHRSKSYQELIHRVWKNIDDRRLLQQAFDLHLFFYNAETQMEDERAEEVFKTVLETMENRLRDE